MVPIRFVYDIACPYAYLAFSQLDRVRVHADVELVPVLLGGLLRHAGGPDGPDGPDDPNTVMSPARAAMNRRDIHRWADAWGVPLRIPAGHPRRTVDAMRVLAAASADRRASLTRTLYEAYWQHGEDVSDPGVLQRLLEGVDVRAAIEAGREPLRTATAEAYGEGAFGVPTFLGGPRLLWGQDRMGLLLRDLGADVAPDLWMVPAPSHDVREPSALTSLQLVHDVASPYSYLASTQVERVAAAAGVAVTWTPILLGALFREIGTPEVPMHAMNERRQAYARRDMIDWAEAWGVPLRFPSHFPLRSVLPQRAMVVEPGCTAAIYRAAWQDDRRVDTPQTLATVLDAAGFDGAAIVAKAGDPAIKAALRENTAAAVDQGLCGVPTFAVGREDGSTPRFWGQDTLVLVRVALDGWVPAGSSTL